VALAVIGAAETGANIPNVVEAVAVTSGEVR
jgi:hypothetical protein